MGLLISSRVKVTEALLMFGYNEESFKAQMREKFANADKKELKACDPHYYHWQFIVHFVEDYDPRISKLRAMYGNVLQRKQCHDFCMSMKKAAEFVSPGLELHDYVILTKEHMTKEIVMQILKRFGKLKQHEMLNVVFFLTKMTQDLKSVQ